MKLISNLLRKGYGLSYNLVNPVLWRYVVRHLAEGILVVFGVVIVVFLLYYALPGDPVSMIAGQRTDIMTKEAIKAELGLRQTAPHPTISLFAGPVPRIYAPRHTGRAQKIQLYPAV
ncbi:MAG: hypothetical protein KatS3mg033_1041 [Thermonema sp.]|uniref:hypothetical protein n=1 Tax=Thermonema sp. TaxID=2231181 RepID=UPI0021DE5B3A|nr:hypothetical protein [Thermonema sp.]GIV39241.1 MAG: hypothetical protein KatS3mg033_1041 [Thermonema sp.]